MERADRTIVHAARGRRRDLAETADLIKGLNRRVVTAEVDVRDYDSLKAAVDGGMVWLAVLGVIASVIGAFYYLRIVFYMYFGKEGETLDGEMPAVQWVMLVGAAAAMLIGIVNLFGVEALAAVAAESLVR